MLYGTHRYELLTQWTAANLSFDQTTWDDALPQLKTDPRFRNSPLPPKQQLRLFRSHTEHLRQKHMANLHGLFHSHSPSLATPFSDLPLQSLLRSLPATKLGFDIYQLEREYERWQRERTTTAKVAFDEMLTENSFVEFWGRLSKIGGEGVDGGVKADNLGEDEGEGGGGKVDMKALARKVNLEEMEKVLRVSSILRKQTDIEIVCRVTNGTPRSTTFQNKEKGGCG